ncbi:MAG: bioF [Gammaproteobacteria bacterium]|jgi:8-amino-7-oxononanoate synthase|nr:bioF [Gammaproteobacteria bacterium]
MLKYNLEKRMANWQKNNLMRQRHVMGNRRYGDNRLPIADKDYLNFASYDYLGLIQHPVINNAMINGIKQYGIGSGASAMVAGYFNEHDSIEREFAKWLGFDKAILFNSGYSANLGVMTALLSRDDTVISDKLCHASLLDGIQLSRAKHYRYQHNDVTHLQKIAAKANPDMIVSESVFSMQGDIAPIADLVAVAEKYQAGLVIDDAHGIGLLGCDGRGTSQYQSKLLCVVMSLGKAFNAMGAMVAGNGEIIESILQFSRSYTYSTALPPALCGALRAALKIIQEETWRLQALNENIAFFNAEARARKLPLVSIDKTPIRAIIIGDNQKTVWLQEQLLKQGVYVAAIRTPTVPKNSARLRISLNGLHTKAEMIFLLDKIVEYYL